MSQQRESGHPIDAYRYPRRVAEGCQHRLGCRCDIPYWLRDFSPLELARLARAQLPGEIGGSGVANTPNLPMMVEQGETGSQVAAKAAEVQELRNRLAAASEELERLQRLAMTRDSP